MLTEALKSQDVRLRRRCMACLGELLFYIAAMPTEAAAASCWHVAEDTLSAVMSFLRPGEDSIVQASAHAALLPSASCFGSIAKQTSGPSSFLSMHWSKLCWKHPRPWEPYDYDRDAMIHKAP